MTFSLVVFGREPVPGKVKTRLARDIGADKAAAVYRMLLERTLAESIATGFPVFLSLAEAPTGRWTPPGGIGVEVQSQGDLGQRMWNAFQRRFSEGVTRVLLIGSDCPGATRTHLTEAMAVLDCSPVVLGPSEDGGYWAIGQRAQGVDCFSGVPWSSPETLQITRDRLHSAGVKWAEAETLADVDTVEDMRLLGAMVNMIED